MSDLTRPYLVIPKLIEQPTWGGEYIAVTKQWHERKELAELKIGQSYELFSGSNFSLLDSSRDPQFVGELTDRDAVQIPTIVPHAVPLAELIADSAGQVLGVEIAERRGTRLDLLIKFTQAMGNSYQLHIKDGTTHPAWIPKPESWYYFEPGLITLGVKAGVDWQAYENVVTVLNEEIGKLGGQVADGNLVYEAAQGKIKELIKKHDPSRFVNLVPVRKGELIDLSGGGLHHSWEEDAEKMPLGNVLYELQTEAMDDVSTIRNFDKGKMAADGSVRQLHIADYFNLIDRTLETNDPDRHVRRPRQMAKTAEYRFDSLLSTKYYMLDKLTLLESAATYAETITQFKHLFVKAGQIEVATDSYTVSVSAGHSCFVPAGAGEYSIKNAGPTAEVLISY